MLELGERAIDLHAEVGRTAARSSLDALFVVGGPPAESLAAAAIEAGLDRTRVRVFADSVAAGDAVDELVNAGDVILVKGSRGIKTDRVVDRLRAERH
jgi:UDP-N-acetylmuramoyl-tripeptide--D-alanyl-D-alanine ligase